MSRKECKKRVCVSGYFNPLTKGHIELINTAAKFGKVIVIVNTDDQVKLKGSIPFQDQWERATIVSNLRNVYRSYYADADKDDTICESLRYIKPDVFINSGDRKEPNSRELAVCKEIGCQYIFIEMEKIQSSSALIEAAAKEYIKRNIL